MGYYHGRGDRAAWLAGFEAKLLQKMTLPDPCTLARGSDRRAVRAATMWCWLSAPLPCVPAWRRIQRTRICLTALAGLRDAADVELIKSFQRNEHPGVRAAALSAWLRLAEQDKDSIALAALEDSARMLGLDAAVVRWTKAVDCYDQPNAQQQVLLTSAPVVASFTQLLHPRSVQPLLARLA